MSASKPTSSKKSVVAKRVSGDAAGNKTAGKTTGKTTDKKANAKSATSKTPARIKKLTTARDKSKAVPAKKRVANKASAMTLKPAKRAKKAAVTSAFERLLSSIRTALIDMKALSLIELDVKGQSDVTDTVMIASGTSDRHVKAIADKVRANAREAGFRVLGMEGERDGEWVLIDLGDAIVHVMLPRVREMYALERLWSVRVEER